VIITIDEQEYDTEEMTEQQKYAVSQLQDINTKLQNLQFQAEQLKAAQSAFQGALVESLKP